MFRKTKILEEKIRGLEKDLREADESNYKKSTSLSELIVEMEHFKEMCDLLQGKVNTLEDELNILKSERKEIEDKTKEGIDKDAVITQLILEKDRLALENLKYHNQIIEKERIAFEAARLNIMQPPISAYFPVGGITYI